MDVGVVFAEEGIHNLLHVCNIAIVDWRPGILYDLIDLLIVGGFQALVEWVFVG